MPVKDAYISPSKLQITLGDHKIINFHTQKDFCAVKTPCLLTQLYVRKITLDLPESTATSCCTTALPFLNQRPSEAENLQNKFKFCLVCKPCQEKMQQVEAKQDSFLLLQTGMSGWSSSLRTPALTQQVPSLRYICNPWSYFNFVASLAMGN